MKKIVFTTVSFFFFTIVLVSADEKSESDIPHHRLSKPTAQGPDIGYALMTKGELVNCFMNFGQITDSYFQTEFYNHMWPQSKGAIASGDNATDDFSFIFARKGNVLDGFTANRQEDWGPVEGSWGRYHAKPQAEELKHQGYPHLAVSDIPDTWPEGYDDSTGNFVETPGERHWPGTFRIDINPDSPTYGEEIEGEFAADRIIYTALDDHDNLQGEPMGIRLDVETYEYGRPYAADFHFYEVTITNMSGTLLDSCWWGYYFDIDYGEYEDEVYYTYSSGLNPGPWDIMYEYDPVIDDPTEFETGVFGVAFLKTPKDMGVTDSHYYLDTGPTTDEELWPIITSNPNDPNAPLPIGDYFHGDNVHLDDYTLTQSMNDPIGFDWVTMVTTGPFDLEPGESVKSVIVVAAGDNVDDFKANISMAMDMLEKYYQGPSGPKAPTLYAVPGDEQVTLYWTSDPENTPDPFSGEYDFEGYKIYRSVDGGQTWGEPILDGNGSLVGYVPIATFDKIDNVTGLDPLNANFFLGDDSGVKHSWIDKDVKNGISYSYTITSYDRGEPEKNITAFESSRGSSETEANFVKVMPEPLPIGFVDPSATYQHVAGYGKGYLDIEVVDPWLLTDHIYQVVFVDSPAVSFNVFDSTLNETKLTAFPINTDDMPVVDGFRIRVNSDSTYGDINVILDEYGRDVYGIDKSDTLHSWYVDVLPWSQGDFDSKTSDYLIVFTSDSTKIGTGTRLSPSVQLTEAVPFEVWNTTFNIQVTAFVLDDGDLTFNEGESIYLVNIPYDNTWDIDSSYSLDLKNDIPYKIVIENAPEDTLHQLPLEGQKVQLITNRAHTPSDRYTFSFDAYSFATLSKDTLAQLLKEIRVVPNPYVVNAPWEGAMNVRRLQFMFLPPKCTISIYTTRGELVKKLSHENEGGSETTHGSLDWNITSDFNQDLAYGIYIYIVEVPNGMKHIGKFALIK